MFHNRTFLFQKQKLKNLTLIQLSIQTGCRLTAAGKTKVAGAFFEPWDEVGAQPLPPREGAGAGGPRRSRSVAAATGPPGRAERHPPLHIAWPNLSPEL